MTTTIELAVELKRPVRTIRAACQRLGIKKLGRDYLLTDRQVQAIIVEMHDAPGRPITGGASRAARYGRKGARQ